MYNYNIKYNKSGSKNMKKIVFTHSINSIVSKFTSLFLAIYFLKITGGNFISVVLYYTLKYSLNWIFSFLSLRLKPRGTSDGIAGNGGQRGLAGDQRGLERAHPERGKALPLFLLFY